MAKVLISFVGLCIHVHKSDFPDLPCEHRVIMLQSAPGERINGKSIEPHIPKLTFGESFPTIDLPCMVPDGGNSYRLNGARLTITNGTNGYGAAALADALPHIVPLGAPPSSMTANLDVILHGAAPAAGYFDVDMGTFSACKATVMNAVGTTLSIDTLERPVLVVNGFGGTPKELVLGTAADETLHLYITNVAPSPDGAGQTLDGEDDYLLNYLILEKVPDNPLVLYPDISNLPACGNPTEFDFGPPCSNSNYP